MHGGLRCGAERTEQRQNLFLLHQPSRRLNAFRRAVSVVHSEELDLAPVYAALFVQHLEIGLADPAEHAIDRTRTAMRHGLSQLDLGIARARIVFLLRRAGGGSGREDRGDSGGAEVAPRLMVVHFLLPGAHIDLYSRWLGNTEIAASGCNADPLFRHAWADETMFQGLTATTTSPGTGALSSLRADKSSSSDSLRPATSIERRT